MRLHDDPLPEGVEAKPIQTVMDLGSLLREDQMELARWIANYYCAPLGEVIRGMLPLAAEVKRQFVYRITEAGRRVLYEGAAKGSSRRSRLTPEEQNREYAVLNYLESGDSAKAGALRSATGSGRALLQAMVKKKWLLREALAEERDARRLIKIAVLSDLTPPKLNDNQLNVLAELASVGGRLPLRDLKERLRQRKLPESSIATLIKRGLIASRKSPKTSPSEASRPQARNTPTSMPSTKRRLEALGTIAAAMVKGGFRPHLLYGVTGSGKTSVYFAAMQRALNAGKCSLLLVPEIGLTPAMAGQMYAAFGDEVALLHSAAHPRRARRAVAPHPPRRGPHRRRHPLRRLRARGEPRPHHRRRRARQLLQAGRDPALPRPRRRRHARQAARHRRRPRLSHALARKLGQRRTRPLCPHRDARARHEPTRSPRSSSSTCAPSSSRPRQGRTSSPAASSKKPRPPSIAANRSSSCSTAAATPSSSSAAAAAKRSSARTAPSP